MDEFRRECELLHEMGLRDNPLRREYEEKVAGLKHLPPRLRSEGLSEEQVARTMHEKRREPGRLYKEAAPLLFREYIFDATEAKYGDPPGPTFDMLRLTKSCSEIIESASRSIKNLDDRLTVEGFRKWYLEKLDNSGFTEVHNRCQCLTRLLMAQETCR